MLSIIPPRLALIIIAARERTGPAPGAARDRLLDLIGACGPTEIAELVALAWIGRGDFDAANFETALRQARKLLGALPVEYLAEMRDLAEYLERALRALDYQAEEFQILPA